LGFKLPFSGLKLSSLFRLYKNRLMVLCPFTSPQNVNLSKVENFPMRTGHGQNPANHRLDVYNPKNNEISNNQPIWCLQDFFHQQYQFRKN